jgi:hypothetical protein
MSNGADNCCLQLINHKQTPTREPHCSLWNIMPWSGLQVNYFPSFQMLSADSSAKFVCAYSKWHTGHCELIKWVKILPVFNVFLLYGQCSVYYLTRDSTQSFLLQSLGQTFTMHKILPCSNPLNTLVSN